jgi:hypothetical protein
MEVVWIGGIVGLIAVAIVVARRLRHRDAGEIDLGEVSQGWITEHRADSKRG